MKLFRLRELGVKNKKMDVICGSPIMENSFVNNEIGLISHSTSAAPFSSPLSLPPSRCGDNPPKLCLGRFDSRNAMTPRRNLPQEDRTDDGAEELIKKKY